jgi:CheY-like chemotaxis protein
MESMESKILKTISNAQTYYIKGRNKYNVFEYLLEQLLYITESEYGFIGEILYKENNMPFFRSYAMTNIAWTDELKDMYKKNVHKGIDFVELNTLFGLVITENRIIISNDPKNDKRRGGNLKIPHGHPDLNSFAGIPFHHKDILTGMVGIANRPQGYSEEYIDKIIPFIDTCSVLTTGYKLSDKYSDMQSESNGYISRLSHDLRTPLNGIFGYCQLINWEDDMDTIKNHNKIIHTSAQILLDIVDNVLLLSSKNCICNLTSVCLNTIVDEQIKILQPMCVTKNIEIIQNIKDSIIVLIDEKMFKNVIINIVSNAIKYNKIDGSIEITSRIEGHKSVILDIKDSGIGIGKDDLSHIFDPFFRSDHIKHIEGNGLGLSIVKRNLVEMNCSVNVHSVKDIGSTFSVTIPLGEIVNSKEILYVEDYIPNQDLVKTIAKKFGFSIDITDTIGNALTLLKENKYKVYLLDMGLPDGTGVDLIPYIKSENIVIVTADASLSTRKLVHGKGVERYITKPFDIVTFVKTIKDMINQN